MTGPQRHGFLLLNKKSGISSFDSLAEIKRAFATGKAGHTGTLDKFASGLLLVLVGRGVKLASLFSDFTKEYTATLLFGKETETLDPEGKVIAEGPLPSREDVESVLGGFMGDILQAPPSYSAVHINGRRAYELTREGKEPEMKKRPVTIHELKILSWTPPEMVIHVSVSAGTYIRSLARDIALAAGSRAYLGKLTRTRVGPFRLEDAVGSQPDDNNGGNETFIKALRPLDRTLFETLSLPCFFIDDKAAEDFLNGKPLNKIIEHSDSSQEAGVTAVVSSDAVSSAVVTANAAGVFRKGEQNELLGILSRQNDKWSYGHVFADN